MKDQSQYQGSQAYTRDEAADESIAPNSGNVKFSKTLVNLRGKLKSIDLVVKASFTPNTRGSFSLPPNWGLSVSYTIPGQSVTVQGKTFVVDHDWVDETGWRSGLRYVNHHGMLFQSINPPQPLPSGRSGHYAWRLRMADGALEFFDDFGKLLEHQDVYGNSIYYSYTDPSSNALSAQINYIIDSWGQKINFQYNIDPGLSVVSPDGGKITLVFGSEGVSRIQDASGYIISFLYTTVGSRTVIKKITYPTGLQSTFEYVGLSALDEKRNPVTLPACACHMHMDAAGNQMSITRYYYGQSTGNSNFTGNTSGCLMGSSSDSLMDSGNLDYRYDVEIRRLDKTQAILQAEEHYLNTYSTSADKRARATSYSQPIQIDHFHYHQSDSTYKPLRRATASYDNFGCPLQTSEYLWDASKNTFVLQQSVVNTYSDASWGGEMLASETYIDHILGNQKSVRHELTSDQRNFISSTTMFRESSSSSWSPWKTKQYVYDTYGRITSETAAVAQYTYLKTYSTDPLGGVGSLEYDTRVILESLKYDFSGRLVESINALGHASRTVYHIGPSINKQSYDALGRAIEISDGGVKGAPGTNRILSRTEYNFLGLVVTLAYDALGRLIKKTGYIGNVKTLNGELRCTTFADDSEAEPLGYQLVAEVVYDGFSRIRSRILRQQATNGSGSIILSQIDSELNIEDSPRKVTTMSLPSTLHTYDIFGNSVTYRKMVTYNDGRQFSHDGPISTFDVCNRFVKLQNQLGKSETYVYNADGHMVSMSRYDGTELNTKSPDGTTSKEWLSNGLLSKVTRGDSTSLDDFSRVTREVDASGRVTTQNGNGIRYKFGKVNHSIGEAIGYSVTTPQYSFDRVISYDAKEMKDSNTNYNTSIQYDGLGQLSVESTHYLSTFSDASPSKTRSFKYDGNFNILQSAENEATSHYTYNAIDQRTSSGFMYDTNGRLLADSKGRKYAYDSEDRLLSVTGKTGSTSYQYYANDALSKMSKATTSSSYYYSSAAVNSVFETDDKTSAWTSYFLHPQGRISAQRGNESATVFLESHNSIVKTVKGTEATSYAYGPYGNTTDGSPRFGWQQELGDPEEGLVYLRSRFYQSDSMSFLTMDNVRGQENRYSYCNGDPINASDPTGEAGLVAGAIVGTVTGMTTGGLITMVGSQVFGISLVILGITASTIAGAAGSLAGDAASAALNGEKFAIARAAEDLLIGAIGGVVGAGSGGLAANRAARMALNAQWTKDNICRIGAFTSSAIGGGLSILASAATSAVLYHQPLFSINTALAAIVGFGAGFGGALVTSGIIRAYDPTGLDTLPVELTEADRALVTKAAVPMSALGPLVDDSKVYMMSSPDEAAVDMGKVTNDDLYRPIGPGGNPALRLRTIIAHGDGDKLYASVEYQGETVYRPIDASLLGSIIAADQEFNPPNGQLPPGFSPGIKLIACYGALTCAPKLARALNTTVWATKSSLLLLDRPRWYVFQ
ncbi:hypothetical protein GGR51DRAFT_571955 [Nemania sp. FL0031]|nr:hypothetical protein GGR51DRAFT_571955 [Nemania sp. FL0031]